MAKHRNQTVNLKWIRGSDWNSIETKSPGNILKCYQKIGKYTNKNIRTTEEKNWQFSKINSELKTKVGRANLVQRI